MSYIGHAPIFKLWLKRLPFLLRCQHPQRTAKVANWCFVQSLTLIDFFEKNIFFAEPRITFIFAKLVRRPNIGTNMPNIGSMVPILGSLVDFGFLSLCPQSLLEGGSSDACGRVATSVVYSESFGKMQSLD